MVMDILKATVFYTFKRVDFLVCELHLSQYCHLKGGNERGAVQQTPQSHVTPRTVRTGFSKRMCTAAQAPLSNEATDRETFLVLLFLSLTIRCLLLKSEGGSLAVLPTKSLSSH